MGATGDVRVNRYIPATQDRICFCCNRRESKIDHVRVGREGKPLAVKMRSLMSWYGGTR